MYGMSLSLSHWMHCNKNEESRARDYDVILFCFVWLSHLFICLFVFMKELMNVVNHKPYDDSPNRRGRILQTLSRAE